MSRVTRDEQHRARRNRLDVRERIEVHELDRTAQRRMRRELRRAALRREFTSRRSIEVVELALDGVSVLLELVDRATGVFRFTALELDIPLRRRVGDDLFPLLNRE